MTRVLTRRALFNAMMAGIAVVLVPGAFRTMPAARDHLDHLPDAHDFETIYLPPGICDKTDPLGQRGWIGVKWCDRAGNQHARMHEITEVLPWGVVQHYAEKMRAGTMGEVYADAV